MYAWSLGNHSKVKNTAISNPAPLTHPRPPSTVLHHRSLACTLWSIICRLERLGQQHERLQLAPPQHVAEALQVWAPTVALWVAADRGRRCTCAVDTACTRMSAHKSRHMRCAARGRCRWPGSWVHDGGVAVRVDEYQESTAAGHIHWED